MSSSGRTLLFLGVILLAAFVVGMGHLLQLRSDSGEYFPPYSTLRADPLGTKALYEGLQSLPELAVHRNHEPLKRMVDRRGSTLFLLGSMVGDPEYGPKDLFDAIDAVPLGGGRLVLSFLPEGEDPREDKGKDDDGDKEKDGAANEEGESGDDAVDDAADVDTDDREQTDVSPTPSPDDGSGQEEAIPVEESRGDEQAVSGPADAPVHESRDGAAPGGGDSHETIEDAPPGVGDDGEPGDKGAPPIGCSRWGCVAVSIKERWGVSLAYAALPVDEEGKFEPVTASTPLDGLPKSVSWHTAVYFTSLTDDWRVVYTRQGYPVVVERDYGPGTIVLVSDSYLFSNEAMCAERHPDLLAWMVGPNKSVYFDETHFGLEERVGVMTIARRYRLHGFFVGLAILALLFVWKNSSSLAPRYEEHVTGLGANHSSGKDSAAGFVNLLRRGVPEHALLGVCLDEWKRTFAHRHAGSSENVAEAERIVAQTIVKTGDKHGIPAAYRAISRVLSQKR